MKIFPSLISADLLNLEKVVKELEPHCDGFHLDIMDGHFVPNITWGPVFVNALSRITQKPLFVHLMVDNPQELIAKIHIGAKNIVAFHFESTDSCYELIKTIHDKKWLAALAVNPETSLEQIYPELAFVDQVLLMSVEPGSSGQTFLPESIERLQQLVQHRKANKLNFSISMDGGIDTENIQILAQLGCDNVSIASAIFDASNPLEALILIRRRSNLLTNS